MKKVLIVEDDRILSFLLEKQVKRLGCEIIGRVASGESAIDVARKYTPDFILMDINLEGEIDGIEAMKVIQSFLSPPFLYLTGNSDPNTKVRAIETKPINYLIKPIDFKILSQALLATY
ncbi:MAG: response regulator [Balneolales bacterium]